MYEPINETVLLYRRIATLAFLICCYLDHKLPKPSGKAYILNDDIAPNGTVTSPSTSLQEFRQRQ